MSALQHQLCSNGIATSSAGSSRDRGNSLGCAEAEGRTSRNIVVEDRLAARIAKLGRHLPQPQRLNRRIDLQLLADPLLERIDFDAVAGR